MKSIGTMHIVEKKALTLYALMKEKIVHNFLGIIVNGS